MKNGEYFLDIASRVRLRRGDADRVRLSTSLSNLVARRCAGACAHDLAAKPRHRSIGRIARDIDQRLVAAAIVKAVRDQVMDALPAHVGEVHRRAGRVLGVHSMIALARSKSASDGCKPNNLAVLAFNTNSKVVGCSDR